MSTIRATYVQHGSSAVPNITLNASGQVIVASGIVSSGTFAAPSGSVSAPGVYFVGDSNTGLYSPAADTIAFTEGGVEALRIDSSGRVGIGTSTVSNTLDIRATGANVGVRSTTSGQNQYIFFSNTADSTNGLILQTGSELRLQQQDNVSGSRITFYTKNSERVRITDTGAVGIGTTSPAGQLDIVTGTNRGYFDDAAGSLFRLNAVNAANSAYGPLSLNGSTLTFQIGASERARIDSSGRFLVGTSSALVGTGSITDGFQLGNTGAFVGSYAANQFGNRIQFAKSRNATIGSQTVVQSGDTLGYLEWAGSDGTNFQLGARITAEVDGTPGANDMPGRLVFSTTADGASSPTERLRITQAGYSKHSNSGSYTSTTGNYHEFYQTANDYTVFQRATFASYTGGGNIVAVDRAANSAYYFFIGSSNYASGADTEFSLRGDGNAFADGSWSGGGADYAEYFEWQDGNPNAEDRRGYPVALVGNKIKIAEDGDAIIGIVSAAPVVLGDAAWNHWSGKYLKDEFGDYLLDENGDRQLNPDYDPTQPYVPREDRPEWSPVGLMGKLRLRKGQPVALNWLKLRDISANVEEWLVR